MKDRKQHWEHVYETKAATGFSWFQSEPALSLRMLDAAGLNTGSWVIDVGGGDSRLADRLVDRSVRCLTVLDVSGAALRRAQARLPGAPIKWIEADVTGDWSVPPVDLWHDRAVFHFLTGAADRARYVAHLHATLKAGGQAVIATFAPDGPRKCSGLPVARYSPEQLAAELGVSFRLEDAVREAHRTPSGHTQEFWFSRLLRLARNS